MLASKASKCSKCPKFLAGACKGSAHRAAAQRGICTTLAKSQAVEAAPQAPADHSRLVRQAKQEGDITATFNATFGRKVTPLPKRYAQLKRNLTAGHEEQLQRSWDDLVEKLKIKTEEVAIQREKVMPKPNRTSLTPDHPLC